MPNTDFVFSLNGGALPQIEGEPTVKQPADNHTSATVVCSPVDPRGSLAGLAYMVTCSSPFKLTAANGSGAPLSNEGTVDSTGVLNIIVGPSTIGVKGDADVTVKIGSHSHGFDARFI